MGSFGLILDFSVLNVCLKVCVEFEYIGKMNKQHVRCPRMVRTGTRGLNDGRHACSKGQVNGNRR